MANDIKRFKDNVLVNLPKNDSDAPLSEDAINTVVENVFQARTLLNINVSDEEKDTVRKEIL